MSSNAINNAFISVLNKTGDCSAWAMDKFEWGIKKTGRLVVPTAIGALEGLIFSNFFGLSKIGPQMGAVQGMFNGVVWSWIICPAGNYVERNSGRGENQIHQNAQSFLNCVGVISQVALPLLLTKYAGPTLASLASTVMPAWMGFAKDLPEYTLLGGFLMSAAPLVSSLLLDPLLKKEEMERMKGK